jgi:hypothetical protein
MQDRRDANVVVMTSGGLNPQVMINVLARSFPGLQVLQEDGESKRAIFRRRAKRLGRLTAIGQLATMALSRFGKQIALRRTEDILEEYRLWAGSNSSIRITRVPSLNSREAQAEILRIKPDVVFLISCRALSRGTLAAISCPIINFHAGIRWADIGRWWNGTRKILAQRCISSMPGSIPATPSTRFARDHRHATRSPPIRCC